MEPVIQPILVDERGAALYVNNPDFGDLVRRGLAPTPVRPFGYPQWRLDDLAAWVEQIAPSPNVAPVA